MRLTLLQKELMVWIIFLLFCAGAGAYYIEHIPNEHPGIIRLHVIANSDSLADQKLKLEVRNEVISFMDGQEDIEASREFIDGNLDTIETLAEEVIGAKGFEYTARAQHKVAFIPEKSYEDLTLPAGNYETLNITLGRGNGQNWWCVIFPQLCLIGEEQDEGGIVIKSKIKEMIKSAMGK